jgi:hypothetical protein
VSCGQLRLALGAHVLGGLDAQEARDVEEHVRGCARCRAEREELAEAVDLLALAEEAPPHVPARVRDRVVAAAARRRQRERLLAVAAAVALLSALAGGLAGWRITPAPPAVLAVPLEAVEPFDGTGWATFTPGEDVVLVELHLDELRPLPAPAVYEAWLSTYEGEVVSIGQLPSRQEAVRVTLAADGPIEAYRGFWVTAEPDGRDPAHDGPTVLQAPVPPAR